MAVTQERYVQNTHTHAVSYVTSPNVYVLVHAHVSGKKNYLSGRDLLYKPLHFLKCSQKYFKATKVVDIY